MVHPDTKLQYINSEIGYGVFASQFIPKGTIVYVKDALEQEIDEGLFQQYPDYLREILEKYSYIDERGLRILSWDHAKYVNHCCQCNTMSTGYGFEIALRDIAPGEEITDEYGLFNLGYEMPLSCSREGCRQKVGYSDLELHWRKWDEQIREALQCIRLVDQPLWPLLPGEVLKDLNGYLSGRRKYRSVKELSFANRPSGKKGSSRILD